MSIPDNVDYTRNPPSPPPITLEDSPTPRFIENLSDSEFLKLRKNHFGASCKCQYCMLIANGYIITKKFHSVKHNKKN